MVSGWMIGGIVTAFIVCMLLVLGAFVTYFKKRGNVQGTLFVLILGMIAVIFTQNIADVIASLVKLPALMEHSYLLAMVLYAILTALIEMLLRLYFVGFIGKSGIGKVRGTVLSCGYVSGQCLMPMLTLFMYITYAHMINQGIFLEGLEVGTEAYAQAAAFQNDLTQAPALMYYTVSAEYIARGALHCFVTMALVRGVIEGKKGKSFGILLGVRAAYEIIYQVIYALCTESGGSLYSEGTALGISLVVALAVIAASYFAWKKVMEAYPVTREPLNKQRSGKQSAVTDEQRKKSLAWQEIRNMNRPASGEASTEVSPVAEETAADVTEAKDSGEETETVKTEEELQSATEEEVVAPNDGNSGEI